MKSDSEAGSMLDVRDEQRQRTWHFKQLRWSLVALARTDSAQPSLFPEQALRPDDLALAFDHWSTLVRETYGPGLSQIQEASLDAIGAKLTTMSRDGTEFDADLWTDAALATSEPWADVRRLAAAALDAFEWVGERPPEEPTD
jgi:hypothetical protein